MVVTFDVLESCVMVFRREQPARRHRRGASARCLTVAPLRPSRLQPPVKNEVGYRKKNKSFLYLYLLHLFGPICISKNEKYRSGRVTVMRFDVFGAFLKLEMNTFVC